MQAGTFMAALTAAALAASAWAGVDNGNELALAFASADAAGQARIRRETEGKLFYFRYLKIVELEKGQSERGARFIRMSTTEPSSDMLVDFTVLKAVSLSKADPLGMGEGIAVTGRVKEIADGAPPAIRLDPVIVRHPDRLSPAAGTELLYEIDPEARRGTDTSSGEAVIIRPGGR